MRLFKNVLHALFRMMVLMVAIFIVFAVLVQERTMTNTATLETTTMPLWQTPMGWWIMGALAVGISGWKLARYFQRREQQPKGLVAWDEYFSPRPVRRNMLARLRDRRVVRPRHAMA